MNFDKHGFATGGTNWNSSSIHGSPVYNFANTGFESPMDALRHITGAQQREEFLQKGYELQDAITPKNNQIILTSLVANDGGVALCCATTIGTDWVLESFTYYDKDYDFDALICKYSEAIESAKYYNSEDIRAYYIVSDIIKDRFESHLNYSTDSLSEEAKNAFKKLQNLYHAEYTPSDTFKNLDVKTKLYAAFLAINKQEIRVKVNLDSLVDPDKTLRKIHKYIGDRTASAITWAPAIALANTVGLIATDAKNFSSFLQATEGVSPIYLMPFLN